MRDIFGQYGTASSESADLQLSLASKLQAKLASNGSTLFQLTWKERVTPSGRLICALRASARSISDNDYISWPTCAARDWKSGHSNKHDDNARPLNEVAMLATWPTPISNDAKGSTQHTGGFLSLNGTAQLAHWVTPTLSMDDDLAGYLARMKRSNDPKVNLKTEPTNLAMQAKLAEHGDKLNGCRAVTGDIGQLNPEFSRWLMGIPAGWRNCAPMATRSSRKSRQPSLAPQST